jgi:superfamily II DNA or RNA helicase
MEHCKQVVAKYKELGMRADFVHSNMGKANDRVYKKLENHELDVIVQVRKLGEGFDHPFLTIAAIFSIFSNLGPFMQFVGRIMRIIPDVDPFDKVNEGVVVFHVGSNITGVWNDFQEFAEADQKFFANLVDEDLVERDPAAEHNEGGLRSGSLPVITAQEGIRLETIALLRANPEIAQALKVLLDAGVKTGEQFDQLSRIAPTKQATRQAKRSQLDEQVKTSVGRLLASHSLSYAGHDLDKKHIGRENFQILKASIDKKIAATVPSKAKGRSNMTAGDLDYFLKNLPKLVDEVEMEVIGG